MDMFLEGWKSYLEEFAIAEAGKKKKSDCDGDKGWHEEDGEFSSGEIAFEEGLKQQDAAYLRGIISAELERAIRKHMNSSGCSFNDLIRAMTAWSQAEKGGAKK